MLGGKKLLTSQNSFGSLDLFILYFPHPEIPSPPPFSGDLYIILEASQMSSQMSESGQMSLSRRPLLTTPFFLHSYFCNQIFYSAQNLLPFDIVYISISSYYNVSSQGQEFLTLLFTIVSPVLRTVPSVY